MNILFYELLLLHDTYTDSITNVGLEVSYLGGTDFKVHLIGEGGSNLQKLKAGCKMESIKLYGYSPIEIESNMDVREIILDIMEDFLIEIKK